MSLISTTTQFQQLVKPGYADAADIAVIDTDLDLIDKIGTVFCTSTTRPSTNLFNGLQIYETDTLKSYRYNGTAWILTSYGGAWDSYVPVWSSTGTQPSLGNGGLNARYKLEGNTLTLSIRLFFGTTTTFGTGTWKFSFPPLGRLSFNGWSQYLEGRCSPGGVPYNLLGVIIQNDNVVNLQGPTSSASNILIGVDSTHPATWTASNANVLELNGSIELA